MSAPGLPARGDCKGTCPAAHGCADRPSVPPPPHCQTHDASQARGVASGRQAWPPSGTLARKEPCHPLRKHWAAFQGGTTAAREGEGRDRRKDMLPLLRFRGRRHQATTGGGRTTPTIRIAPSPNFAAPAPPPGRCFLGGEAGRERAPEISARVTRTATRRTRRRRSRNPRHRPGCPDSDRPGRRRARPGCRTGR